MDDPRTVPTLLALIQKDRQIEVRRAALNAFARTGHPEVPRIPLDALADREAGVRLTAVEELSSRRERAVADALGKRASGDGDSVVRLAATKALATFEPCWAGEHLVEALDDSDDDVIHAARAPLETWRDACVPDALIRGLRAGSDDVQRWCAWVLGKRGDASVVPALIARLDDPNIGSQVLAAVISALAVIGDRRAVPVLLARLDTAAKYGSERPAVIEALGVIGDRGAVPALIRELRLTAPEDAVRALGMLRDPQAVGPLVARLHSPIGSPSDKELIEALVRIGDLSAVPALLPLVGNRDSIIRDRAVATLQALTGQTIGADRKAWEHWWRQNRKRAPGI